MKLDNPRIVIRERGYLELLDLGLRVPRDQAGPLFLGAGGGGRWAGRVQRLAAQPSCGGAGGSRCAVDVLGPHVGRRGRGSALATAPATICLGRALFNQSLAARQIAREFLQSLPQLLLYQVLLRGLLVATVVASFVPFVVNPYMNEVVLLERNPLSATEEDSISTGRRSSVLHRGEGGDLFLRWMLNFVLGAVLVVAVWGSLAAATRLLLTEDAWARPFYTCLYPAALWIVAAYFTVVRFLGYLDLRIRREGWEVELLMRAERDRWLRIPRTS